MSAPAAVALFAVVRSWHPAGWWRGAGLSAVAEGDLAVVIGGTDRDRPDEQDALRHFDVVTRLILDGPVLPFPLGTLAPDAEAVRDEVLALRADDLRARLDVLDDVVEMRVDVRVEFGTALRGAAAADPGLRSAAAGAGTDERLEVGERVAEVVARWCAAHTDEMLAPLAVLARTWVRLDRPEERVERRAYLLPRSRLDEADAVLAAVTGRAPAGTTVVATGPLPAYDFLDDADPSATSHWGW